MKRIFITGIAVCLLQSTYAQDVFDALRYSYPISSGTARTQAIGGANISLGGDISSAFINPAGIAQFKTNELVLSPGFNFNKYKINYNDTITKGNKSKLNGGTSGVIFSFGGGRYGRSRNNTTLALAVNQTANFNTRFTYGGRNLNSSYTEKWLEEISYSGVSTIDEVRSRFPLGASQAYESYLIDIVNTPNGDQLITNADISKNINQQFAYETKGGMTELAAALAWNSNDKVLYGVTIGIPIVQYDRQTVVTETDGTGNTDNDFESFRFTENLATRGGGINAKLGVLFKPVEYFRIGLTFHTPTVMALTDYADATITSNIENYSRRLNNDPNRPTSYTYSTKDVNELTGGGDENRYSYQLVTPWRAGLGLSYVFREISDVTKQKAFITGDVELINYKAMNYSSSSGSNDVSESNYFNGLNSSIDEMYKMAINARIGGELKFKTLMVRAGFNFMGSPYNRNFINDAFGEDLPGWRMTPSLGLGYRDKGVFFDLTYAHAFGRDFHVPYTLQDAAYPFAKNNISNGQVVATVGFKF